MDEQRISHLWSDVSELHHAGNYERRQRDIVPRDSYEFCLKCDEQRSYFDGHSQLGTDYHDSAHESDSERRPDGDVLGDGDWNRTP